MFCGTHTGIELSWGKKVTAAIFIFGAISVFTACRSVIPIMDNPKYQELESLWKNIPVYSGFVEGKVETTSTEAQVEIIHKYKSDAEFADVKQFYGSKLPPLGWKPIEELSVKDRGRIRGERIIVFQKEDYWLTIHFAGERSGELGWDYAVWVSSPKDWHEHVF